MGGLGIDSAVKTIFLSIYLQSTEKEYSHAKAYFHRLFAIHVFTIEVIIFNHKLQGTAYNKRCQRRIYKRSLVDPTLAAFNVCGPLQFMVSHLCIFGP